MAEPGAVAWQFERKGTLLVDGGADEDELGQDFGYIGTGSIGDTVWYDVNGDEIPDIIHTAFEGDSVPVLLGNGDGTFQTAVEYDIGDYGHSIAVGDFNEDGYPDLVSFGYDSSYFLVLLGRGDLTFDTHHQPSAVTIGFEVADFNDDGHQEVVAIRDAHA